MELMDYLNARIESLGDAYDRVCEKKTNLELDNDKLKAEIADLTHEVKILKIRLKGAEDRSEIYKKAYDEVSDYIKNL